MRVRTQFNNFALQEMLGAGGMGAVYKALDLNLQRLVALKVVRKEFSSDPEYLAKFEREARITAAVNHPHVVKVFSFGSDHGLFYIAMELVDKGSLDELMNLQGRVSELQVLQVGIQVAQGLEAAHRCGLIHRDVKPGNILFADARTAKIVDFGLALLAEQEAEARGEVWGTPYYVAPEKLNHEPEDFRSDIYSLGGTLFHAVAGRPPFEAETASMVALKHIKSQKVSLQAFAPDVSSATAYVINRMLQKDPEERYQSYSDLIEHLVYARTQLEESVEKPRAKLRVRAQHLSQDLFFAIVTLVILGALVGFGYYLFSLRNKQLQEDENGALPTPSPVVEMVPPPPTPAPLSAAERYKMAKTVLGAGEIEQAKGDFHALASQELQQPLRNWVLFHEGLIDFLQGKAPDARALFKKVQENGPFSDDLEDRSLAKFFVDTARIMSDPDLKGEKAIINKANHEALALFLYGLSEFDAGRFERALEFFEAFEKANPEVPYEWIGSYKPLAAAYAKQLVIYLQVTEKTSLAETPREKADALESLKQVIPQVIDSKLKATLMGAEKLLSEEIAQARRELHAAERSRFEAGRAQFEAACLRYDFSSAKTVAEAIAVETPGQQRECKKLIRSAEWLQGFKEMIMQDVSNKGYPYPVIRKDGTRLSAGANAATSSGLEFKNRYGSITAEWREIPPNMLLAIADHYLKADVKQGAQRAWLMGVFACHFGMEKQGQDWLLMASKEIEQYRRDLGLFFGTVTAEPSQ